MAPQLTGYPNGQDSTGLPKGLPAPIPEIQIIRASDPVDPQTIEAPVVSPTTESETVRRITTEQLYSEFENVSPELNASVRLLSLCLRHIDRALLAHRENDPIEADDATQRLQGLLPELFCC